MDSFDLDPCLMYGSIDPHESPPPRKRHLDRFSRFCTAHPSAQHRHTGTHTTLRATSVAICRISGTACRRCGLVIISLEIAPTTRWTLVADHEFSAGCCLFTVSISCLLFKTLFIMWPWTLICDLDLDSVKMNQHVRGVIYARYVICVIYLYIVDYYFASGRHAECCDLYVCLPVGLSLRSHISKSYTSKFHQSHMSSY